MLQHPLDVLRRQPAATPQLSEPTADRQVDLAGHWLLLSPRLGAGDTSHDEVEACRQLTTDLRVGVEAGRPADLGERQRARADRIGARGEVRELSGIAATLERIGVLPDAG